MSAVGGTYPRVTFGFYAHQDFVWGGVEHARGKFDFQAFDAYVADAQARGLVDPSTNTVNMAMTLAAGTPAWAVANQSTCTGGSAAAPLCTAPPDNIEDWKDFLAALVQHYNGKTQPHIKYYELWNEMNINLWWSGTNAQMLALAQAAYPVVHQDPYSILLTPSVAGPVGMVSPNSQVNTMTQYLQAGGSKYADGGAFHGYIATQSAANPFPFPMPEQDTTTGCKPFVTCHGSIITMATQMRAVFDQNGLAGKPMFQTEGSWGNLTVADPDTQVEWLSRYMLLQAGLRSTLNLQMAAWFTWAQPSFGWGDIADASLEPTAAGVAYSQLYDWMVGATISQPCSGTTAGLWTCTLTRPGGYQAIAIWSTNGSQLVVNQGVRQVRDLAGNTTSVSPTGSSFPITGNLVGASPILLESVSASGSTPTPLITLAANAEGEVPLLAPNTWIEIKGFNLAPAGDTRIWKNSDFSSGLLPTALDGVSVTVNGQSAYVYYISPTQVNVLTPPDAMTGPVQVQLTSGALQSPSVTVIAEPVSPSFFVFNGGSYVAAEHADGSLIGPTTLYPGSTTPAKPGETIMLYANGFGPTSVPVVPRSLSQSGTLTPLPVVTIGGAAAKVTFAGLVAPGEFQFNVVVPPSLPDGDQSIAATYSGSMTQSGALLSVQH